MIFPGGRNRFLEAFDGAIKIPRGALPFEAPLQCDTQSVQFRGPIGVSPLSSHHCLLGDPNRPIYVFVTVHESPAPFEQTSPQNPPLIVIALKPVLANLTTGPL